MGRSSKSDRKRRNDDDGDETLVASRHSSTTLLDQNESKRNDSSRRKHRHHRRDHGDDRYGDQIEEEEISRMESDRHQSRKNHEKKHRRDRSKMRKYSSDDNDSDLQKSSRKKHHRKHGSRRDDSGSQSERDSGKRKKRRRNDDAIDKRKSSKKERSMDAIAIFDATEQTKLVDKSKLHSLGEQLGHPPDVFLDPKNDYFAQNQRFRIYLYRECGLTFDELSSNDAHMKFKDFVQRFNAGDLEEGYYAPHFPNEALEECPSTRHQWSLKITHQDAQNLQILQEGIRKQTEYQSADVLHSSGSDANQRNLPESNTSGNHNHGEAVVHGQHNDQNTRVMNRRLREHAQTTIEELTGGRKEGRERLIEKRQERAAKIHGASKYQQDMVELDDTALYGGNTDDEFRRLAAASRQRAAAQEAKKEERILELQQKEKDKQNAMLQMLGLSHKIGQSKIQIQPRNDPPNDA